MQKFNAMPRQYRVQESEDSENRVQERGPRRERGHSRVIQTGEVAFIIANAAKNAITRDNMNQEQFIDGLFDLEIQELILREDPKTFNDAINRSLNIDAISRGSRLRQRR